MGDRGVLVQPAKQSLRCRFSSLFKFEIADPAERPTRHTIEIDCVPYCEVVKSCGVWPIWPPIHPINNREKERSNNHTMSKPRSVCRTPCLRLLKNKKRGRVRRMREAEAAAANHTRGPGRPVAIDSNWSGLIHRSGSVVVGALIVRSVD